MLENKTTTNLSDIGEFKLIEHLASTVQKYNESTIKGIGDDAAVIDAGDHYMLITSDMLVEGVHFDMVYTPLKHLGYKSIVVNLSDIYAMNGTPKQVTVSLAISSKFTLEAIEELYAGMNLACKFYGVDLVGGDTTTSLTGMVIGITAVGTVEKNKVAYRSGAKEYDLLCVSGDLGAAFMGLQLLEREKSVYKENPGTQPDLEGHDYVLERQLKPEARKDIIKVFNELNIVPTSMIDVSDGLASETMHICKQSGIGCDLYIEKIPIDHTTSGLAEQFNLDPITCALSGGEDYELLFTLKQADYDKIKSIGQITVIGHMTGEKAEPRLVTSNNEAIPLKAQGWDAFKK